MKWILDYIVFFFCIYIYINYLTMDIKLLVLKLLLIGLYNWTDSLNTAYQLIQQQDTHHFSGHFILYVRSFLRIFSCQHK